ncbi:MAG: hypothetical protein GC193_07000, partial [Cryomorphaceae bacterium]|nr:hypothetical protein [Cryomorphaceae bacterium]
MKKIYALIVGILMCAGMANAQIVTAFTKRFDATQKGSIDFVSNTILQCNGSGAGGSNCGNLATDAAPGFFSYSQNNDHNSVYIDIDGDPSTFSSTSDSLNLPDCSEVLWAGLYWGAQRSSSDAGYSNRNKIKIKVDDGSYQQLTADVLINNSTGYVSYHCFKNITSIVQNNPNKAVYTIADMYARTGTSNLWGAWNIVVVYKNDLLTMRNLTVYDGIANVSGSTNVDIPISGFLTPLSGPVTFDIGVYSYDGDRGMTGDQLQFNGGSGFQNISNATNPTQDIFNSTATIRGVESTSQNPLILNNISYDADIFTPDNSSLSFIGNSATSCVIRETTGGETILSHVITMAIDVYEPDVRASVSVNDLNGGDVEPGDVLEYRVKGINIGSDPSINTYISDEIEVNATYVPGSIEVVYGPNLGPKTDGAGDDEAEYDPASRTISVRIGTGANETIGGFVNNSPTGVDSTVFIFRAQAATNCISLACDNIIDNQAFIFGTGNVSGNTFNNGSNPGVFDLSGCPIDGTTSTPINSSGCVLPGDTTITAYCQGFVFADLPYVGYSFFDDAMDPISEPAAPGLYFAVIESYPGCTHTVEITVDAIVVCVFDNDNDGVDDDNDLDDDNDGIPDTAEGTGDTDGDGIPDVFDLDSDNDGIADVIEAGGTDTDGDGLIDGFTDANNDGLDDATAATPRENPDSDGDGLADALDIDADGDGIVDNIEA